MSCYNPMIAINSNVVNPRTGKRQLKFFCSAKKAGIPEEQWRDFGEAQSFNLDDCYLIDDSTGEVFNRATLLPCGQCLGCRTAYAAQWADRLMIESLDHEQSYFITLTYDEEHVPHSEVDPSVLTLRPKDLQYFIKRLRDQQFYHYGNKIRYYAVGEYGSLHHRGHYHMEAFGLILDDLYEIGKNKLGRMLHSSKVIEQLWPFGRVEVDFMTWETAAYCARYTVKKLGKKETGFYEEHGLVPEFSRMSLKPGIGQKYFDEHFREIYEEDKIHISTGSGARTVKPPRYYDKKYDDIYPDGLEKIKANRQSIAKEHLRLKMQNFSGSYFELLANEEQNFKNRTKTLRRELEL